MGATTTPSITSLLSRLSADFPELQFQESDDCAWNPTEHTVYFQPLSSSLACQRLIHELSHAVLEHACFSRDIDLIAMERDAWHYAKRTLGPRYGVEIEADTIDEDMDTYREWLHARSTCPNCTINGLETARRRYTCVSCRHQWQVNDARTCDLRRTALAQ